MLLTVLLQFGGEQKGLFNFILIGLMFVVMYFLMIRPQMKKRKEEKKHQEALKKGDKVVTTGGIHGKVVDITPEAVVIETGAGKIKFEKSAISLELTASRYSVKEIKK